MPAAEHALGKEGAEGLHGTRNLQMGNVRECCCTLLPFLD